MKRKKTGFTMVEILTVVGIIAILVAVLVPTLSMVRRIAKETQQKAQLTAIELALIAFKADYGDYPPSDWQCSRFDYSGAQMLAEALLGWDLIGFHPDSEWTSDGESCSGDEIYPDPLDPDDPDDRENLRARRGPYLELAAANAFRLGVSAPSRRDGLFDNPAPLEKDTFVLCDVFAIKKITQTTVSGGTVIVRAGTPILYYRANTSSKIHDTGPLPRRIYNGIDNLVLTTDIKMTNPNVEHKISDDGSFTCDSFYEYITDPKITAIPWPYRPDSYILISAGADGLYGTSDDICNF